MQLMKAFGGTVLSDTFEKIGRKSTSHLLLEMICILKISEEKSFTLERKIFIKK
jgi:hypothetical protein